MVVVISVVLRWRMGGVRVRVMGLVLGVRDRWCFSDIEGVEETVLCMMVVGGACR